jgi:hypothetical protein
MQECAIIRVGLVRQIAMKPPAKQSLALVAMTDAERMPTVIRRGVTERVEEQAVDVIPLEPFARISGAFSLYHPALIHTRYKPL